MRKYILFGLMAAVALPAGVSAQSRGEIRRDREDVREQREDVRDARRDGRENIRNEREDLREARQELREDRRDRRQAQYVAPYRNWRYSTLQPGARLRPAFYGSRYVIGNPARYQLRPGTRNQQWVRYGDDLMLVNVRNGRVMQVVRNRYR